MEAIKLNTRVLALAGGVGGAKLALGLSKLLRSGLLTVVVNTGDDEEFYGLQVSPDLDTVMYTLAGVANPDTGWGLQGETFTVLDRLGEYGEETWFKLGDRDLATHIRRTALLREGRPLSEVTSLLCKSLGVGHSIIPMTDARVRTIVDTEMGPLAFQDYFVRHRCEPRAKSVRFEGSAGASPSAGFAEALATSDALVFCPSNPYLSIAPILSISGVRERIREFQGRRIAVSPIVGGQALRGPAAKLMSELGDDASCVGVARQYVGLCDVFVIDNVDAERASEIETMGFRVEVCNTVMTSEEDKVDLARRMLEIAGR
jgi:LPPG:FO 2-phospho-L-lactate transferase